MKAPKKPSFFGAFFISIAESDAFVSELFSWYKKKKYYTPLGVPADLKSAVKKCPNLLMLCGFEIRSKGVCFFSDASSCCNKHCFQRCFFLL